MTNRTRVLLWTDTPAAYQDAIASAGLSDRVAVETLERKQTPSATQKAEIEVLLGWGAPAGLLPQMKRLRWTQALTAGIEGWLALPDLPPDMVLSSARGTHRYSMPENILGMLFYLTKPYAAVAEDHKQGKWVARTATPLSGQTLGILGLGAIGQDLARMAGAVGMRVIGTKRDGAKLPGVAEVYPPEQTDQVLAQSDFLVLLLPSTPATDNFMNTDRLSRMKPTAWLLNFGRGHLIVDEDLIAAVKAKKIAGAMLDVFRQEPLPESHPFWKTEGITVLPHIGGHYPNRDKAVAQLFADNLGRFLDGKPLQQVVDRAAGY
jgi:phosphoglycerate dehydrogenase-like enzyme